MSSGEVVRQLRVDLGLPPGAGGGGMREVFDAQVKPRPPDPSKKGKPGKKGGKCCKKKSQTSEPQVSKDREHLEGGKK